MELLWNVLFDNSEVWSQELCKFSMKISLLLQLFIVLIVLKKLEIFFFKFYEDILLKVEIMYLTKKNE